LKQLYTRPKFLESFTLAQIGPVLTGKPAPKAVAKVASARGKTRRPTV